MQLSQTVVHLGWINTKHVTPDQFEHLSQLKRCLVTNYLLVTLQVAWILLRSFSNFPEVEFGGVGRLISVTNDMHSFIHLSLSFKNVLETCKNKNKVL